MNRNKSNRKSKSGHFSTAHPFVLVVIFLFFFVEFHCGYRVIQRRRRNMITWLAYVTHVRLDSLSVPSPLPVSVIGFPKELFPTRFLSCHGNLNSNHLSTKKNNLWIQFCENQVRIGLGNTGTDLPNPMSIITAPMNLWWMNLFVLPFLLFIFFVIAFVRMVSFVLFKAS